jgi:hypothetical protein
MTTTTTATSKKPFTKAEVANMNRELDSQQRTESTIVSDALQKAVEETTSKDATLGTTTTSGPATASTASIEKSKAADVTVPASDAVPRGGSENVPLRAARYYSDRYFV